jgi:hypothetical protein
LGSGFRGEDLNVIFYQNMSNLYNQYKSVERKNSQKNPEYMNQIKANLAGMVLGWSPFNIVSNSPALHSRWLLLLKIEMKMGVLHIILKVGHPKIIST